MAAQTKETIIMEQERCSDSETTAKNSKKLTDLPTDILIDIVSRLPFFSVIRCLACKDKELSYVVSKLINANRPRTLLACDNQHIKLVVFHENNENNNIVTTVIPIIYAGESVIKEVLDPKFVSCPKVLCVYNGLVLVLVELKLFFNKTNSKPLLRLVNPVTGRISRALPNAPPPRLFNRMCDPNYYGMGYSPKTGRLKIVRLSRIQHSRSTPRIRLFAEVLESVFSTWRRIKLDDQLSTKLIQHHGSLRWNLFKGPVVLNGAIHWLVHNLNCLLLRFDIDKETFDLVDYTPPNYYTRIHIQQIGLFRGSLYMSIVNHGRIGVLVMNDYGVRESWTRLCSNSTSYVKSDNNKEVFDVFEDGKILIQSSYPKRLHLYDSSNCKEGNDYAFVKLDTFGCNYCYNLKVWPFVPNLR